MDRLSRHTRAMSRCIDLLLTSIAGGLGGGSPSQRGARGAEPPRIHVAMQWGARAAAPTRMRQGAPVASAIAITMILTLRQLTGCQKCNILVSAKYCITHLLASPTRTPCPKHANARDCCLKQSRT